MSDHQELEMQEIKNKVNRLEEVVEDSLSVQKETSQQLGELVTQLKIKDERESRQEEKNSEFAKDIASLKLDVGKIHLERAEEKQSRVFLMKYWPWLLVGSVAMTGIISALTSGAGKNLIG